MNKLNIESILILIFTFRPTDAPTQPGLSPVDGGAVFRAFYSNKFINSFEEIFPSFHLKNLQYTLKKVEALFL